MTKLLAVPAAGFLALTALLSSSADAGFSVQLKLPTAFSTLHKTCDTDYGDAENDDESYGAARNRSYQSMNWRPPKPTIETPSPLVGKPVATTQVEPKPVQSELATESVQRQNSSIATAHDNIAASTDTACKNYFASAGMTLSVSCGM